jgi:hypothetical protein
MNVKLILDSELHCSYTIPHRCPSSSERSFSKLQIQAKCKCVDHFRMIWMLDMVYRYVRMALGMKGLMFNLKVRLVSFKNTDFDILGYDLFSPIAQHVSTFVTQGVPRRKGLCNESVIGCN